ncbi:MAG: hypothetical protein COW02_00905 [Comamonadaceae bacterium CG12_big_fil_rev_8_21_14_0_65_59_15]|nr:MAG: hypothetical protein COW02_00905 [Comamonadaceae bacterium CG12_big_fil_rev_8_21_14_0_65_59_15]
MARDRIEIKVAGLLLWYSPRLSLIEDELVKRNIKWIKLTGQSQKHDALIDQFTSGDVPLFLISLKAGGTGLNLPQADTVIHYDQWMESRRWKNRPPTERIASARAKACGW